MKKKQTLDEFLDPARVARAGMGEEEWQKHVNELRQRQYESILSYKKWMDDYKESAECKARDKLEEELRRLKDDSVISKSETCVEIVEAFLHCVVYGWSFSDSARMLQPIGDEFERLRSKQAVLEKIKNDPKQKTKSKAKEYWDRWQAEPHLYKGPEAYAKDMMNKFGPESDLPEDEMLENIESPRRWQRKWKKEATTRPVK